MIFLKNNDDGDSSQVSFRPLEPFDDSVERFFAPLWFDTRGNWKSKIGSFDWKLANFGKSPDTAIW